MSHVCMTFSQTAGVRVISRLSLICWSIFLYQRRTFLTHGCGFTYLSYTFHPWKYPTIRYKMCSVNMLQWFYCMISCDPNNGTDPIGRLRVRSTSSAKLMMGRHKIKPVFKNTCGSVLNNWPLRVSHNDFGLYTCRCSGLLLGMRTLWLSSKI